MECGSGAKMTEATDDIHPGETWALRSPKGFEAARLIVGAVVEFASHGRVICCAAIRTPSQRTSSGNPAVVPFIAMTEAAFHASVTARDRNREPLPDAFFTEFETWRTDPRGASVFNVPFEGTLERMIAQQMAAIANIEVR